MPNHTADPTAGTTTGPGADELAGPSSGVPTSVDVLARLAEAVAQGQAGDRAGAGVALAALWREVGDDAEPLLRCGLAHALADVQDDPLDELAWDERALVAGQALTQADLDRVDIAGPPAAFLPSLHLNLADVHLRLGHLDEALGHVGRGLASIDALPDDGYRQMISEGLARVEAAALAPDAA
jgi:hypothetical protein